MPWWLYILIPVLLSTSGWVALRVVSHSGRIDVLEDARQSIDDRCEERLAWLRGMDAKLDDVRENTREIKGFLQAMERR